MTSGTDLRPPGGDGLAEAAMLVQTLDYVREGVVRNVDGLTLEQALVPGVESGLSLAGLLHHLTGTERFWLGEIFDGQPGPTDFSFDVPVGVPLEELVTRYRGACAASNDLILGRPLEQRAVVARGGEPRSLRWIALHLVEETARHAGHGDILREQLDGRTGR